MSRLAAAIAALMLLFAGGDPPPAAADAQAAPVRSGHEEANTVSAWGNAADLGPPDGQRFAAPVVGIARAGPPGSDGYWQVAADGGVFAYGTGRFLGSAGHLSLTAPIVGMASTPSGDGYWLAAADGGVFAFGEALYHGSLGGVALNSPVVGIAADPSGRGYWLVAADGGVFAFGDARYHGSMGAGPLSAPVVDIAASPDGHGYWLAGQDGEAYPFGVSHHRSPAGAAPTAPIVGMAARDPAGYWFTAGQRRSLSPRDTGPDVRRLQERLTRLGYWVGPVNGVYGELTEQAVYAFQKVEGLAPTGRATAEVRAVLARASRPRSRGGGDGIEVDKSRQVLFVVRRGDVAYAFNTSTGTEKPYRYEGRRYVADTPPGHWRITWQFDGYRTSYLGRLYRPKYFHRDGIAVHGYSFVPPYPASHGCVRVTPAGMDFIWEHDLAPIGSAVWVYGSTPVR